MLAELKPINYAIRYGACGSLAATTHRSSTQRAFKCFYASSSSLIVVIEIVTILANFRIYLFIIRFRPKRKKPNRRN